MIFSDFRNQVLNYARFQGQDIEESVRIFLNQAILEFLRKREWEKTISKYTLTLDGSGTYDLSTLITNYFHNIYRLIQPGAVMGNKQFMRIGYDEYVNLSDKSNMWSLVNKDLYIEGDSGDIEVFYQTPGTPYPVTTDDDEPQILIDYPDILEKYVVVKLLAQIGDMEQANMENQYLAALLNDLTRSENRAQKRGRISSFASFRR